MNSLHQLKHPQNDSKVIIIQNMTNKKYNLHFSHQEHQ